MIQGDWIRAVTVKAGDVVNISRVICKGGLGCRAPWRIS